MSLQKQLTATSVLTLLLASTVIASPFNFFTPSEAQAQSRKVRYIPPKNLDAPKVSNAGISRTCDFCLIGLIPLRLNPTTMTPRTISELAPRTISERPTIYFLSPKFNGSVTFKITQIGKPKSSYKKEFKLNAEKGVIAFRIPDDAPTLEVGKTYKWTLNLNGEQDFDDTGINGYIHRITPQQQLVDQLKNTSSPIDRAALLGQSGIWYETIQTLAEAKRTMPKNSEVAQEWSELLQSVNLGDVVKHSFVAQKR